MAAPAQPRSFFSELWHAFTGPFDDEDGVTAVTSEIQRLSLTPATTIEVPHHHAQKVAHIVKTLGHFPQPLAGIISEYSFSTGQIVRNEPFEGVCSVLTSSVATLRSSLTRIHDIVAITGVLTLNSTLFADVAKAKDPAVFDLLPPPRLLTIRGTSLHSRQFFETVRERFCADLEAVDIHHEAVATNDTRQIAARSIHRLYQHAPHLQRITIRLPDMYAPDGCFYALPPLVVRVDLPVCTNPMRAHLHMVQRSLPEAERAAWQVAATEKGCVITKSEK